MILFHFQIIDFSRSRSQKGYQKIYCYIHFGLAEILHCSLFCGLFIFLSFTLWDPYVFDFKCNRSTMSWSRVNLHVHSYTDLQSPYFSFVATLFLNILPYCLCIALVLSIVGRVVFLVPLHYMWDNMHHLRGILINTVSTFLMFWRKQVKLPVGVSWFEKTGLC